MATRIIVKSKLFAAVIFLTAASFAAEVRFEDNGAALINPGMGWTMHYYSNVPKKYGGSMQQKKPVPPMRTIVNRPSRSDAADWGSK